MWDNQEVKLRATNSKIIVLLSSFVVAAVAITTILLGLRLDVKPLIFIGEVLLTIVVIHYIWECYSKRALVNEILAIVGLSKSLTEAGIVGFTLHPYKEVDWPKLFETSDKLTMFCARGQMWMHELGEEYNKFLKRQSTNAKIIFPNPEDRNIMEEFARRYNLSPQQMQQEIYNQAREFLPDRESNIPCEIGNVSIKVTSTAPTYVICIFDRCAVVILARYKNKDIPLPTFIVKQSGKLYEYFSHQLEAMTI